MLVLGAHDPRLESREQRYGCPRVDRTFEGESRMLATLLVIAALIGILAFPVVLVICMWAHREK
jgi:hypothetical protein